MDWSAYKQIWDIWNGDSTSSSWDALTYSIEVQFSEFIPYQDWMTPHCEGTPTSYIGADGGGGAACGG